MIPQKTPDSTAPAPGMVGGKARNWRSFLRKKSVVAVGLSILLVAIAAVVWFTNLKYPVFGLFAKGRVEVVVTDATTNQPLKGATVAIAGQSRTTNDQGKATLEHLNLGQHELKVSKTAYKTSTRSEKIFLGTTTAQPVKLQSTGIAVHFKITDKISGLPLAAADVAVGGNANKTNQSGEATVMVLPSSKKLQAKVTKAGYLAGSLAITTSTAAPHNLSLLPAGKTYFLSNRNGKMNVYQSNLDGSDQQVILAGTGKETTDTRLHTSPDGAYLALESTREGLRGASGGLVRALYLVDVKAKTAVRLANSSEGFVGWKDTKLFYTAREGNDINLYSYDTGTKKTAVLDKGVSVAVLVDDVLLLSYYSDKNPHYGVYRMDLAGHNGQQVTKTTGSIVQASRHELYIVSTRADGSRKWEVYNTITRKISPVGKEPFITISDNSDFSFSADGQHGLVYRNNNRLTTLYLSNGEGKDLKTVAELGTAASEYRWVSNEDYVYTVRTNDESAQYVRSIRGGNAKKVSDVFYNSPKPSALPQ